MQHSWQSLSVKAHQMAIDKAGLQAIIMTPVNHFQLCVRQRLQCWLASTKSGHLLATGQDFLDFTYRLMIFFIN